VVVSFDNIPQDLLIRPVKKHAKEQWIVLYIGLWLKAAVQEEDCKGTTDDVSKA